MRPDPLSAVESALPHLSHQQVRSARGKTRRRVRHDGGHNSRNATCRRI